MTVLQVVLIVFSTFALIYGNVLQPVIVGGLEATQGQFPHQVSIRNAGRHICGGSIINPTTIVTAAHCLEGLNIFRTSIVVGCNKLQSGLKYFTIRFKIHENYNAANLENDIALIKVLGRFIYSKNIRPIPILTENVGGDVDLVMSGWGMLSESGPISKQLMFLKVASLSHETCSQIFKPFVDVPDTKICVYRGIGFGACYGDSGGPLMLNGKLVGIASSIAVSCAFGLPDSYTRVEKYVAWIEKNV